ncbi:hypothetical protein ACFY7Z_28995 [Streptomyces sp. NPDC012623]|uniref:hypothetical protein n=1 Tax=unclassified Streptomyces TaxID=2593676 RepID=UPI0036A945B7
MHVDDLVDAYVHVLDDPGVVDAEVFVIADDQRPAGLDVPRAAVCAVGWTGGIAVEPRRRVA